MRSFWPDRRVPQASIAEARKKGAATRSRRSRKEVLSTPWVATLAMMTGRAEVEYQCVSTRDFWPCVANAHSRLRPLRQPAGSAVTFP